MRIAGYVCLSLLGVAGCTPGGGRRGQDGGARPEATAPVALERAVIEYLWRGIDKARKDRSARARLPAACPSPLVDWEALQLSELHSFATLGLGDGQLLAIAKPRPKGPPDERTCLAKIAFRFREEPREPGRPRVQRVWLSDQPEPQKAAAEDEEEEADAESEN